MVRGRQRKPRTGSSGSKGEAVADLMLEVSQFFFRIRAVGQRTGLITGWGGGAFGLDDPLKDSPPSRRWERVPVSARGGKTVEGGREVSRLDQVFDVVESRPGTVTLRLVDELLMRTRFAYLDELGLLAHLVIAERRVDTAAGRTDQHVEHAP